MKNIKLILISFFLLSSLFSCQNKKDKLTIPEKKLIKVFFDIHSAEYIINRAPANEKDSLSEMYMSQIFRIHKITKKEFEKNISILRSHPENFKNFYEKLNSYGDTLLEKIKDKGKR